ncbi:baseplate J/gp47 family protein [Paenibacillus sp. L3-i20]|uniref:baseplate J/gp47 family protein n=1 Tax=Paenibacillus sp. L3-i20 TaxID=2905833 RepID=UPI001EDEA3D8|nr:baseplate J/gp47 family protein [Paenibacillus sp. L3-i20]GKU79849.1 phage tail protein [Paenibacillus sp. L3-i20]
MYEHLTYEFILQRMLDRVPDTIDKREGSLIYNALAPSAAELAQAYIVLGINDNLAFADTSTGEELSRITAEDGVNRAPATTSRRKGTFTGNAGALIDIPIGSRFSIENVTFVATSKISTGVFEMTCEQSGSNGNKQFGALLPIVYINGLETAALGEVLIPGEDEEDDETLRARYYAFVNEPPFGGNVSDYKEKVNEIDGIGGVKVYPTWNGGGTVKCTIIASDWSQPTTSLISAAQMIIDPVGHSGKGMGTAPIGHTVSIVGVQNTIINFVSVLTLKAGVTVGQVQAPITNAISNYLLELRQDWAEQDQTVVRVAMIDAAILTIAGVVDVSGTKLNGTAANVTMAVDRIPVVGTVTLSG